MTGHRGKKISEKIAQQTIAQDDEKEDDCKRYAGYYFHFCDSRIE